MNTIGRRQLLQLAALAPTVGAVQAFAQPTWPERPIRFVVGYPAGQSVDIFARHFASSMSKDLGQSIIVDNRAGANGILGAQEVKQSKPDGYTFLFGTSGQMTINPSLYKKLPYDTMKDFAPVGLVLTGMLFLLANPSFPPNNFQELVTYARARPGSVDYGSGGQGITAHLAMELLQASAGIKLNHVPYKGTPAALNDVMGGQIPLMMDSGASALQHVRAGKLKVLASTGSKRAAAYPSAATLAEQGLKDFDVAAWHGIFAPAGTPMAIIDRMNAAARKANTDPKIVEALRVVAAEAASDSPAEFKGFLQAEIAKWSKAVAQAGVQLE